MAECIAFWLLGVVLLGWSLTGLARALVWNRASAGGVAFPLFVVWWLWFMLRADSVLLPLLFDL